jgi:hypothetical protein
LHADYDKIIARYKSEKLGDNWSQGMKIVPVNLNSEHKALLGHCKMIMENDGGRIANNPDKFDKLITSLRTACRYSMQYSWVYNQYYQLFINSLITLL